MAETLKAGETSRVQEAVQEVLTAAENDVVKATALLQARVMEDRDLYREIMDPLVRTACYDLLRRLQKSERRIIWQSDFSKPEDHRSRVIALAGGTLSSLLNFPLPSGLRLGDATRQDVLSAAAFYAKQANDMAVKSCWLELVAKRVKEGTIVRDVLDDRALIALKKKAEQHV
jgi:hypothetical protein